MGYCRGASERHDSSTLFGHAAVRNGPGAKARTDGSMLPRPRGGGAGILFVLLDDEGNEEHREEMLSGFAGATQNQLELEAPIQALKMVTGRRPPFDPSRYRKIVIKTDATYVAENFGTAASVWSRNGWKTHIASA
jgi:ribonuclease HI